MLKKLLLILLLAIALPSFSQVDLVFPKNNTVFDKTSITLSWNEYPNAVNYHVQVAFDAAFTLLIKDANSVLVTDYIANNLLSNQKFYWRVKANNSVWSPVYSFTIVDFRTWPELEFMLDPDSVILDGNNRVQQWKDLSGNGHHFIQNTGGNRPQQNTETLANNQKVIDFNPNTQNFLGGVNLSSLTQGEIFALLFRHNFPPTVPANTGIWGFGTASPDDHFTWTDLHIYSGFGRNTRIEVGSIPPILNPMKPLILNISSDSRFKLKLNNQVLINSVTGTAQFKNGVTIGKSNANYYFDGAFGNILFFNTKLNDSLNDLVGEFYQSKYAPPINLGKDIAYYGICDTLLRAQKHFTSYLWSDGSTADSLIVTQPGKYWCRVTDIFGNISTDTIKVINPKISQPLFPAYCPGEILNWKTDLDSTLYSFQWSDGSDADSLVISTPGTYYVRVTDTLGCFKTSDTLIITEDDFALNVALLNDTSLCSGNKIGLVSGSSLVTSYLWSTGETTPQITIFSTGEYSLIATNANGCEAKDTVNITVIGDAPFVNFNIPLEVCLNEPFTYTDASTTSDGSTINTWNWDFGDLAQATSASGSHAYANAQSYTVTLSVQTSSGCGQTDSKTILVRSLPELTIQTSQFCENELISFMGGQNTPTIINNWSWNFDDPASGTDNTASTQNSTHTFEQYGTYIVQLIGSDIYGCIDTANITKKIYPQPITQFTFNNICEGGVINFINTSNMPDGSNILSYAWNFGDGTTSTFKNPQKPYISYGEYYITLTALSEDGCSNQQTEYLKVHAYPQVASLITQNCAGIETHFLDQSFVPNGSVAVVKWSINNQTPDIGLEISHLFNTPGTYSIKQDVNSAFGCFNTKTFNITIHDLIQADFTVNPPALIAGTPIDFIDNSIGANSYTWSFGNYAQSHTKDTSIIFDESLIGDTIIVQLLVNNSYGCSDSMSFALPVLDRTTDLELGELYTFEENGFLSIGVELKNNGTTPITKVELELHKTGLGTILEHWEGTLLSGEKEIYIFSAKPSVNIPLKDTVQSHICINGRILTPAQFKEDDLTNNEVCQSIPKGKTIVIHPFPNPIQDKFTLKIIAPDEQKVDIDVTDNTGKLVYHTTQYLLEKGINNIYIDSHNWATGGYRIIVRGKQRSVVRIVKSGKVEN